MKKIVLLGIVLTVFALCSVNFYGQKIDQDEGTTTWATDADTCILGLFEELFICLSGLDATGNIVEAGNQYHIYVTYQSSDPGIRGRIQNCVADYNNSRHICADAPVMVIKRYN
ncbi:MAG: hypothetical protein KJ607_03135 [Bacteroidetes bacterium]|nr:hypothetical protein [Bacteroidota bacterium]